MMPPRSPLTVVKLSDHFGQYVLTLKCERGHTRTAQPQTLAALAGWDAFLADVVKRLRCSHYGSGYAEPPFDPRQNGMANQTQGPPSTHR